MNENELNGVCRVLTIVREVGVQNNYRQLNKYLDKHLKKSISASAIFRIRLNVDSEIQRNFNKRMQLQKLVENSMKKIMI